MLSKHHDDNRYGYEPGRQGTGYWRLHLKAMFDALSCHAGVLRLVERTLDALKNPPNGDSWAANLLHYPVGAYIPRHLDDARLFCCIHHRLNAVVRAPTSGGQLLVNDKPIDLNVGDAYVFLPDDEPHEVKPVLEGERIVFTVGCWWKPG